MKAHFTSRSSDTETESSGNCATLEFPARDIVRKAYILTFQHQPEIRRPHCETGGCVNGEVILAYRGRPNRKMAPAIVPRRPGVVVST